MVVYLVCPTLPMIVHRFSRAIKGRQAVLGCKCHNFRAPSEKQRLVGHVQPAFVPFSNGGGTEG
jgi:hypothetical protein